jgi:hypothetical protein
MRYHISRETHLVDTHKINGANSQVYLDSVQPVGWEKTTVRHRVSEHWLTFGVSRDSVPCRTSYSIRANN